LFHYCHHLTKSAASAAQLEDPAWKPVYGEIEFECGHWGVFENAIDMAHIHYLHADSFGNKVCGGFRWCCPPDVV
jgi:phenylpropionate dioxygenase-like ring-hydroxylating dioxygenase large terminal subunit